MSPAPRCARHPLQPATDLCVRCADFVCSECSPLATSPEVLCPDCRSLPRLATATPAARPVPARAPTRPEFAPAWAVALVLGTFSCACFPAAPVGAWLAIQALRHPAPNQPRNVAGVALALNLLGPALALVRCVR